MKISMTVDKLTLAYKYGETAKAGPEYQAIQGFKFSVKDKEFSPAGSFWKVEGAPFTVISQPLPSGASMVVKFGFVNPNHWSWVTVNPAKVHEDDWPAFGMYMGLIYNYGVQTLFLATRIKQLDVAVDIEGASFFDYVFVDRRLRAGDASLQSVGSVYLGHPKGRRGFLVYDKGKEIHDKGGPAPAIPRLRIEARLRDSGVHFHGIAGIENPLKGLRVVSRSKLDSASGGLLADFRDRLAKGDPADIAYFDRPKEERLGLWTELGIVQAEWWDPDVAWALYPKCLQWLELMEGPVHMSPTVDYIGNTQAPSPGNAVQDEET